MKKSKLLVLGLIALVLAGGLALASCGLGCPGTERQEDYYGDVITEEGGAKGRCFLRLNGRASQCKDRCIDEQWKKQGGAVDLYCDC